MSSVYVKKEVPAKVTEVYSHKVCDCCGERMPPNIGAMKSWDCTVSCTNVEDDGYNREKTEHQLDICPVCWKKHVLPALRKAGYKTEVEEQYYASYRGY